MNLTKAQKRKLIKLCDDIQELYSDIGDYSITYYVHTKSISIYIFQRGVEMYYYHYAVLYGLEKTIADYTKCHAKLKEILTIMKGNDGK